MTTIYLHIVNMLDGKGAISKRSDFSVTKLNVIGENERFVCVDDASFTTIDKVGKDKKFIIYPVLNKPSTTVHCNDSCWGSGVWYKLYSHDIRTAIQIRSDIRTAIKKKVGFFMEKLDLSFITQAKS